MPTRALRICRLNVSIESLEGRQLLSGGASGFVTQTNLVSDGFVPAAHNDPHLKNPWGVAFEPNGLIWVADNNGNVATIYDGTGAINDLVVNVPGAGGVPGNPTGQVYNGGSGFQIHEGNGQPAPATFIYAGEDGSISGWNQNVDLTNAIVTVDNSASGAVYKGAALGQVKGKTDLFVTNFHDGTVEVYDDAFNRITLPAKAFHDKSIPAGFAPFNVQNVNGQLFVTYAKQDADAHDDVGGAGAGFVDVYSTAGKLKARLQHGDFMNSPWGIAVAPKSWGKLSGDILVGEFKSGQIDVFSHSHRFVGTLNDNTGAPIQIDGLWALTPGNGAGASSNQSIFFTAGVNDEQDGLFGSLTFSPTAKKSSSGGGSGLGGGSGTGGTY